MTTTFIALMLFLAPAQDGVAAVLGPVVDSPVLVEDKPIVVGGKTIPTEPTPKEAFALVDGLKGAVQRKDYSTASAFLLMAVVWFLRQLLKDKEFIASRPDLIPWLTLALACSTGCVVSLGTSIPLGDSLLAGGVIGLSASGGWSLIGKHIGPLKQKLVDRLKKANGSDTPSNAPPAPAPSAPEAPKEKP